MCEFLSQYILFNIPSKKFEKGMVAYPSFKLIYPSLSPINLGVLTYKNKLWGFTPYQLGVFKEFDGGEKVRIKLGLTPKKSEEYKNKVCEDKPLFVWSFGEISSPKTPIEGIFAKLVRGMRYTCSDEKRKIDLAYIDLFHDEICTNPFHEEYEYWYSKFSELSMLEAFFNYCDGERV